MQVLAQTKKCKRCGDDKALLDFGPHKTSKDRLQYVCRPCGSARAAEWIRANPEQAAQWRLNNPLIFKRSRAKASRKRVLAKHELTEEHVNIMIELQGNKCAICHQLPAVDKLGRRWRVDHDHKTGKVRGMLCSGCNLGLGHFKDTVEFLEGAVAYLKR